MTALRSIPQTALTAALLGLSLLLPTTGLQAQAFRIDITGVGEKQTGLVIGRPSSLPSPAPLSGSVDLAELIETVVNNDLRRTGAFRLISVPSGSLLTDQSVSNLASLDNARRLGADAVVGSSLKTRDQGKTLELRFRVMDTGRQLDLGGLSLEGGTTVADARRLGHRMADYLYEQLTGEPGFFSTRLAYVRRSAGSQVLMVADSDGENGKAALRSSEPILSVTWSPDGSKLAYVSFESGKPVVYSQDVNTGRRQVVANHKGSNSSPAWAPDSRRLAVVLTRDGGSQIFLTNEDGSGLRRLTDGPGINTEPSFSPDGSMVYFTSDRGGAPQVYRMSVQGGRAERVTFTGTYNARPRVSPDGKTLAYVAQRDGRFVIAAMNLSTGRETIVSEGNRNDSPSFAPNGKWIIYSAGRDSLAAASVDGRVRTRLSLDTTGLHHPAWGSQP